MKDNLMQLVKAAAVVLKERGAREVYIFGSVATGNIHEDSDVDIAVEGLPPELFFKVMGEVNSLLGRSLDLIDLDEQSPFTRYLKEEGELIRVA